MSDINNHTIRNILIEYIVHYVASKYFATLP